MRIKGRYERYKRVIYSFYNYKRQRTLLNYPPYILWIEPTNHCNLACIMCTNAETPKVMRGYMDIELFRKIIDEAHRFIFDINLFLGGESLLHKDIIPMIAYARSKDIKVCLHTNATKLNSKMSRDILETGLDVMSISFERV